MKRITSITFLLTLLSVTPILAQIENPDFMQSIGKIYVVVASIVATFIGIVLFLIFIERRLSKLENQINDK